jgi:hypothetical protein
MPLSSKNFLITGLLVLAGGVCSRGQTKPETKPEATPTTPTRPLQVSEIDGGSASTSEYGVILNKDTSLHRKWYVLNDRTCPLQLSGAGVTPAVATAFVLKGDATTSAEISAIDVVAVLFDLWGDHSRNLRLLKVKDLSSNTTFPLSDSETKWPADEDTVREYQTSVTYVRRVRLTDGKVWLADMAAILRQITDARLKVSKEDLEVRSTPK